jgi:5'-3' exonuclease
MRPLNQNSEIQTPKPRWARRIIVSDAAVPGEGEVRPPAPIRSRVQYPRNPTTLNL